MRICVKTECEKPAVGKKYCNTHYMAHYRAMKEMQEIDPNDLWEFVKAELKL